MPTLPARFARPFFVLALLFSTVALAGAQQAEPPALPTPESVAPLTASERARYVGVYEMETPDGLMRIHIYEEGERLMGRPEHDEEPSPLTPVGNHRFVPELMREAVITFTLEGDRATRFAIAFPDERGTVVAIRQP